ncbi:MAG: protein translocase subunit SecF, partial [Thiogranum sp.]
MQILNEKTRIDFMGRRKYAVILSSILIIASFALLFTRGLSFGIDFTGGTLIEVAYPETAGLGG